MLDAMQSSWETYTRCDPRPDASSERELNTFLSQGADEEVKARFEKDLAYGCLKFQGTRKWR